MIAERLADVRRRMAEAARAAGRDPASVRLVAVSKRQPVELIHEAYALGVRDFGENYVQAAEERRKQLPPDARWHLIGHLQSNKAARAAALSCIHTIDSGSLAAALSRAVVKLGAALDVLLQIDISREATKSGIAPEDAGAVLEQVRVLPGLRVVGLMCIPARGSGREAFAALRSLRDELCAASNLALEELSMGMSDDFEAAILEGATLVRVGTAIFGERSPRA